MTRISIDGYEPHHLSFSTVAGYRDCGMRMKLQKIERREQRPGLAGIGGNAVHTASELVDLAAHLGVDLDTIVSMHKAGEL